MSKDKKQAPSSQRPGEPKAESKPEAKSAAKPKAESKPEAKSAAKPKAEAKTEVKSAAEPKAESKPEVKSSAESKAESKPELKSAVEPKAESKPEAKSAEKPKAEAKTELKSAVKSKAESKPEVKSAAESKAEAKPELKSAAELKAEAKTEAKLEVKSTAESKAESKPEVKSSAESKAEAKPELKSAEKPKAEAKVEEKQKASDKTEKPDNSIKLEGLFAFKMSMTAFYSKEGKSLPVTALKYEPAYVSQIKKREKESYSAVQVAFKPQKNKRSSKALIGHLKPAGFKEGARFAREIRQSLPENIRLGQKLSIESLKKGDLVKISSFSKGRGFAGVMKRWNFAGGKASHGSKSHRRTGSIGQHTEPARVMPGRKMPGRYGFEKTSRLKVPVVDVLPEEGIIFVKGPVPGARNSLVSLRKMN